MGNLTLEDVNNMYLDVLKEIGNIGAGNATTAIANMLGMKIDMNVPNVKLMEVSKLGTAVGSVKNDRFYREILDRVSFWIDNQRNGRDGEADVQSALKKQSH